MNKSSAPLVTVVIPTYNHARYLKRAIQSILDQSYMNWELIIIDNHSTDNTDQVIAFFQDTRITYLKIHNDGIIAKSRNAGIRLAKGEWIAFLDSDDLWYPKKLQTAIEVIRYDSSIDVCCNNEFQVDEVKKIKKKLIYGPYCCNFYRKLLVNGNCLSTSATMVKREFLKKNTMLFRENKEFVTVEDYDFWMLLARAGANFKFIKSIQGEYTIHNNNASGQSSKHRTNLSNLMHDHIYQLQTFNLEKDKLWRYINSGLLLSNAKNMLMTSNYSLSFKLLINAFFSSSKGTLNYMFLGIARAIESYKKYDES